MAVLRLSLAAVSGGYSLLRCVGFSLQWLLSLWITGSGMQAEQLWCLDSRAQAK